MRSWTNSLTLSFVVSFFMSIAARLLKQTIKHRHCYATEHVIVPQSLVLVQNRSPFRLSMASFASSSSSSGNTDAEPTSDASRASDIVFNASGVKTKILEAARAAGRDVTTIKLVAVSKTKPIEDLMALYNSGLRDFGENYFQELCEKAEVMPKDINWHFIGHLQSAKASKLVREVTNLVVVETVDSIKLAKKLNTACETAGRAKLDIYLQVDTSGEDTKSGVPIPETAALAQSIRDECPLLNVAGLMTIGAPGDMGCFDRLSEARVDVAAALGRSVDQLGLSMGMSGDFEEAIARGATSVRVGSTIFGARNYAH